MVLHVHSPRGPTASQPPPTDRRSPRPPLLEIRSNLQLLRKTREDSTTCLCDDYHIFLTRAANAGIVKTRLDREHLAIFQNHLLQTRMFVDFQAESVAGAMEKSDPATLAHFCRETATGEEFL